MQASNDDDDLPSGSGSRRSPVSDRHRDAQSETHPAEDEEARSDGDEDPGLVLMSTDTESDHGTDRTDGTDGNDDSETVHPQPPQPQTVPEPETPLLPLAARGSTDPPEEEPPKSFLQGGGGGNNARVHKQFLRRQEEKEGLRERVNVEVIYTDNDETHTKTFRCMKKANLTELREIWHGWIGKKRQDLPDESQIAFRHSVAEVSVMNPMQSLLSMRFYIKDLLTADDQGRRGESEVGSPQSRRQP